MGELMITGEDLIIEKYGAGKKALGLVKSINEEGIKRFKSVGLPGRKDEMYTYLDLKSIDFNDFDIQKAESADVGSLIDSELYSECKDNVLVFVDGIFSRALSKISLNGLTIDEESEKEKQESLDHLTHVLKHEKESFALLNSLFLSAVTKVRVKGILESPVQIIHILSSSTNGNASLRLICPRLLIVLEKGSKASFYEKHIGNMKNSLLSYVADFLIKEDAELGLKLFQKKERFNSYHFSKRTLYLAKGSKALVTSAISGTKLTRSHYDVYIKGEKAYFSINGIAILKGNEQSHSYIKVHHKAKDSISEQVFKSIVTDKSKASIDTTVVVHKGAQKTNSMQLMQSLILSDDAKSDNKPNLMIYADDVKCNHGVTIGNVDEASILYLRTRGIGEKEARRLLLLGFVQTIIDDMSSEELISDVEKVLLAKLEV